MKTICGGLFVKILAKDRRRLKATKAGLRFLNSPDYEKSIVDIVNRDFESGATFYQLLIGVTAAFLCGVDPFGEDPTVFDEFICGNIPRIRAAIDRVKTSVPQIAYAEEAWIEDTLAQLLVKSSWPSDNILASNAMTSNSDPV